jgi:hypothetical protein
MHLSGPDPDGEPPATSAQKLWAFLWDHDRPTRHPLNIIIVVIWISV